MAIQHKHSVTGRRPSLRVPASRKPVDRAPKRLPGILTRFAPWAMFLAFSALYLATRTTYNTFDAVSYANQIAHLYVNTRDPHWLFHPHHLLFNATGYVLWRIARSIGYIGGPLVVLDIFNGVVAALGVTLFYLTLRRLMQRSNWLPAIVAAGLGLSFGYWVCATDARVNAASTTLLLGSFAILCVNFERMRLRHAMAAGLVAGLAVLYHESAGLFLLVGLTAMGVMPSRAPRAKLAAYFTVGWAAVVVIAYAVVGVFVLHLHSLSAFHAWSTEYADLGWWWSFNVVHNLRPHIYALRHAAFVEPPGKTGTFHLAADTPTGLLALYFSTLIGWFVAVYYFIVALPLLWRTHYRPILIISVVWTVVYGAFFTVWQPRYFVFWVPALVPISLILALTLAYYRSQRAGLWVNWLAGIWVAMFATVNVMSSIGPHTQPMSSPFQRIAREYKQHTNPGDIVLVSGAGDLSQLEVDIPYFADRDTYSIHSTLTHAHDNPGLAISRLRGEIRSTMASGHNVYIADDLYHLGQYGDVVEDIEEHHHGVTPADLSTLFEPWTAHVAWSSSHGPVWELTPLSTARH